MMAIIKTLSDSKALARAAAIHFVECAQEAISEHGRFVVALAGGSTPRAAYETLATVEFVPHIHWEKVHVFWGDERCVAPNHEDSNYRMAFNVLLKHSPIPVKQIYRMEGELDPKEAAQAYENRLQAFFGQRAPRFDLILLGLGQDGHTASLFPGSKALEEKKHWVAANYVRRLSAWRLTLTAPLINQAANVTFLVSGQEKAEVLQRVLAGRYTPEEIPAQMIRPDHGQLRWLMDAGAGALL
jgi:6-phosphogluconolactonase